MPRLATGVGGLDWSDFYPLIENALGDLNASVFIYDTCVKGKAVVEKPTRS